MLLKEYIAKSGLKLNFIAGSIGITRYALYLKLNNKSPFKSAEMFKLAELLNISNNKMKAIFFADNVDK